MKLWNQERKINMVEEYERPTVSQIKALRNFKIAESVINKMTFDDARMKLKELIAKAQERDLSKSHADSSMNQMAGGEYHPSKGVSSFKEKHNPQSLAPAESEIIDRFTASAYADTLLIIAREAIKRQSPEVIQYHDGYGELAGSLVKAMSGDAISKRIIKNKVQGK